MKSSIYLLSTLISKLILINIIVSNPISARPNDDLLKAAQNNNLAGVQKALRLKANVDYQSNYGRTALFEASIHRNNEIVKLLLDSGANPQLITKSGNHALNEACHCDWSNIENNVETNRQIELVKMLINAGGIVKGNEKIDNPIIRSGMCNFVIITKLMIDKGADVNIAKKNKNTPLALVASISDTHIPMAKLLILSGANVNATNSVENTALHYAAQQGLPKMVQLLLNHGANPDHKNKFGMTPISNAQSRGYDNIVKLLQNNK